VANVQDKLAASNLRLPSKCLTSFVSNYHLSEDTSKELDAEGTRYFQELIGVLRWAIELGRVDILLEVALLLSHLALPRTGHLQQGHLQQVYHIFGYLDQFPKRRLYFDPDYPNISKGRFQKFDWVDFYRDATEDIPQDMPQPRGNSVEIHCFVKKSTDAHLMVLLTKGLQSWRKNEELNTDNFPEWYHQLISEQNAIGWRQLFNGRWSKQWSMIQHQHYQQTKTKSQTGHQWTK